MGNNSSAIEYPHDIDMYIKKECHHNAILDPFAENPIPGRHSAPFMTKHKPNFLFIYLGFYNAFSTDLVIHQQVVL